MKYGRELIFSIFLIIIGSSISIFFAVMGIFTYVRDNLVESPNWGSSGSPFDVVPFGIVVFILGCILFLINYFKEMKKN